MASSENPESQKDELNDSWVELHYGQTLTGQNSPLRQDKTNVVPNVSSAQQKLEMLLIDAQRESRTPSRPNSNESSQLGSPTNGSASPTNGSASPNTEWSSENWRVTKDPGTDWIWDWSSQPELPPAYTNWSEKLRHPGTKPGNYRLSWRNSQVIKKTRLFSLANLPTLLFTHACTFFLGAAAVLIYFKKYCNLPAIAQASLE